MEKRKKSCCRCGNDDDNDDHFSPFFLPSSSQIPHRMHNRFFLWDSSPREFITAIGSQPIGVEACL